MKKLLLTLSMLLGLNSTLLAELTQTQLNATLDIVTNFILDDGAIVHHGKSYKKVTSPHTGRVWLDRNLGAERVCTSYDDAQCYGDYYQWGRGADGHEKNNSGTSSIWATDVSSVGHGDFILSTATTVEWTSADSNATIRASNWRKSDGTSVCPAGFRVPTLLELKAELWTGSAKITDKIDAFDSFLKLPSSGMRIAPDGSLTSQGDFGLVWSLSLYDNQSNAFFWSTTEAIYGKNGRAMGSPVRCIKDSVTADITPPYIALSGDANELVLLNSTYSDGLGALATDNVGFPAMSTQGSVDTTQVGNYYITYIATDAAGNVSTVTRYVTVTTEILTHNGFSYGVITSPYTGKKWLDRNLGASRICLSSDDSACYGDYYQWGRDADGHEKKDSFTTATLATDITNVIHSGFITKYSSPYDWASVDSSGLNRAINWYAVDGSFICPSGYRVPTTLELRNELFDTGSAEIQNNEDAHSSFLMLPSAGFRRGVDGVMFGEKTQGELWSVDYGQSGTDYYSEKVYFRSDGTTGWFGDFIRTKGSPVRCIGN